MLTYSVDAQDRIVAIDGPWDEFAAQNGAPLLTREAVLSRPILSFVAGREMKVLTSALLTRVRTGEALALEFRCDSPGERRYLLFESFPLPNGTVHCATTLVRSEHREPAPLVDGSAPADDNAMIVCSWCLRVRLEDNAWVEVDEAIATLGLFLQAPIPQISHGICPDCRTLLRGPARRPAD